MEIENENIENNTSEELKKLIDDLTQKSDSVTMAPSMLNFLKENGIEPDEPKMVTWEEYIDGLKVNAAKIADNLPQVPNIPAPAIRLLYDEIRKCIILGLNGAAITLSGILVEYMLKFAAYKVEMGGFGNYDAVKLDKFENMDFSKAIGVASAKGLLTKEEKKLLNNFRENVRNPYNHYNIKKITEQYHGPVNIFSKSKMKVEQIYMKAVDDPILQSMIKPKADADLVLKAFTFADSAVKNLWLKIVNIPDVEEDI